ncbi:MAG: hypothetical protein QM802_12420 [Agriterribacter sp.]
MSTVFAMLMGVTMVAVAVAVAVAYAYAPEADTIITNAARINLVPFFISGFLVC